MGIFKRITAARSGGCFKQSLFKTGCLAQNWVLPQRRYTDTEHAQRNY